MPDNFQARPTARRLGEAAPPQGDTLAAIQKAAREERRLALVLQETLPVYEGKLAGSTFATPTPDGKSIGQKALQLMQSMGRAAFEGENPELTVCMVPETNNAYDPDAVMVMLKSREVPEGVKLGYLPNPERRCLECAATYPAPRRAADAPQRCIYCAGTLRRDGIAYKVSQAAYERNTTVDALYRIEIAFDTTKGITGGGNRTHGLNLRLSPRTP